MDTIRTFLNYSWVGSLISLAGLIAAFALYRASRIGARPTFQFGLSTLLSREGQTLPSEITVLYRGVSVERLRRTHVMFWNSGKSILRGADIVEDDPLRFVWGAEGLILNATIVRTSRTTNRFALVVPPEHPNEVRCQFDYLDPGDGATIEVLHTAKTGTPECRGTIRGVPAGVQDWGRIGTRIPSRAGDLKFRRQIRNIVPLLGATLLVLVVFVETWPARAALAFFGLGYLLIGIADIRAQRRAPRALRIEEL